MDIARLKRQLDPSVRIFAFLFSEFNKITQIFRSRKKTRWLCLWVNLPFAEFSKKMLWRQSQIQGRSSD